MIHLFGSKRTISGTIVERQNDFEILFTTFANNSPPRCFSHLPPVSGLSVSPPRSPVLYPGIGKAAPHPGGRDVDVPGQEFIVRFLVLSASWEFSLGKGDETGLGALR